MAWYDDAIFYHIYPLGLSGAEKINGYNHITHRLNNLIEWIDYIKELGCNALYIGPLFESGSHGYDTTDYYKLDSRLGNNEDLKNFVYECHKQDIKVILDGVFNHVGRDFFAFKDLRENKYNSRYIDWFCDINFNNNNEYDDGFSYANWGGYNLLVKLNLKNNEVKDYLFKAIRMWVDEFDIDGLRLDAADVLDFDFMHGLRLLANDIKEDFWLMGEVIHGDYTRWVNDNMLHSVTDYNLHKALYSAHNDHNYFELAHTVKRIYDMGLNHPNGYKLYNFVDNHDVERIYTILNNKNHFIPIHILLFTLPGIPSIYYGSEFAIEGKKQSWSDDSLRPEIALNELKNSLNDNYYIKLIKILTNIHHNTSALYNGDYNELLLTTKQYAFIRRSNDSKVIVMVNNDDNPCEIGINVDNGIYHSIFTNQDININDNHLYFNIGASSGEIFINDDVNEIVYDNVNININVVENNNKEEYVENRSYEDMSIEELQNIVLEKLAKNGPITEQMKKDVENNIWKDSLINWIKSF